jgi:glycine/D-amino acid oxidase-like deaminating enzyme
VAVAFEPELVEAVFEVEEHAFDADKLAARMASDLEDAGVRVELGVEVTSIVANDAGFTVRAGEAIEADYVFNCTYARFNQLLGDFAAVPLKHELTEMALIQMPPALQNIGITVMCGPFWSAMPFPPRGLHTLSHVRYTPHCWWTSGTNGSPPPIQERASHFPHMIRDARRFFPPLADAQHVDSLWQVKTVLPRNETDDGRPILFWRDPDHPGLVSILGGKIDNVYDLPRELAEVLA